MDTVSIKLPVSGSEVIIRNYTTREDDKKADEVLYIGVNSQQEADESGEVKQKIVIPLANIMASTAVYVRRLVDSIDGDNQSIAIKLDQLHSKDYQAIEEAIDKIVEEHSPKAKEAKNVSKTDTKEK